MEILQIFFILLIALLILFFLLVWIFGKSRQINKETNLPYKRKDYLMNVSERKFFEELIKIIPNNYEVFPQVPLSRIVETTEKTNSQGWRNKIDKKVVDYVVFELPYYKPVVVIEYDGKTHTYPNRVERDQAVDSILATAGISNFHIKHSNNIDFEEIKKRINEIVEGVEYNS